MVQILDTAVKRAKLLARMINLIMHSLKAKPYEQFVASFSNPLGR
jgi:hypothetical protein